MPDGITDTIIIEFKPIADPQTENGYPARDPDYRLKLLLKRALRSYGLRAVRVTGGKSPHGPPCPGCGKPTDDVRRCRCWTCSAWLCLCGKLTTSVLISLCHECQLAEREET